MNRLRTILLTMLLAVAYTAAGQGYVIDSVCQGAERHYRIDGETGSTYTWTLTDPQGTVTTLPETADTVTINWTMVAGNYILSTLQTSIHGCDSLELGTIKIFENPEITGIQTFTSTNGLANGYAIVNAVGVAAQSGYSLDGVNWQTSNVFTKLLARTYNIWVRNVNGCVVSQQFTILNTIAGEVNVLAGDVISCVSTPFDIPVMAEDFTAISAFTIQLTFNPALMVFNSISDQNTMLNKGITTATVVSPGILEIKFNSPDSVTIPGHDHLLDLNFSGLTSGQTDLDWKLVECVIYSGTGYEMPTIYTNGSADIRPVPQIYTEGSGGYCEKTPLILNAGSLTGRTLDYDWTSPDGSIHSGAKWNLGALAMSDAGVYQVTAHDGPVCATTETINVEVYTNPNVSLSAIDTLCSEQVISLNAGLGFEAYKWQDGSTDPQIEVTKDGLYWVVVTDYNGCKASDSVILKQCELLLWMPNVFTPDGDGLNDIFLPVYKLDVDITFQMYIFNKWGEQIFSTNEISRGWDGTYKGVLCKEDLYTWRIIFSAPDNYKFRQISPQSGNVMLLK